MPLAAIEGQPMAIPMCDSDRMAPKDRGVPGSDLWRHVNRDDNNAIGGASRGWRSFVAVWAGNEYGFKWKIQGVGSHVCRER